MLSEYLIRCGVILQFVPPGANPAISEPLPINPPAIIRQVGYQEEGYQEEGYQEEGYQEEGLDNLPLDNLPLDNLPLDNPPGREWG